jgi:hypothetical protein
LIWPNALQRQVVAAEYAGLRNLSYMMADLAMRNYVYSAAPNVDNLFAAGIAEGRRRAVLEIFKLARIDPRTIADLHRSTTEGDRHAA